MKTFENTVATDTKKKSCLPEGQPAQCGSWRHTKNRITSGWQDFWLLSFNFSLFLFFFSFICRDSRVRWWKMPRSQMPPEVVQNIVLNERNLPEFWPRRRNDWLDDGHGAVDDLILARWLSCGWLLHWSCHLLFISCFMKRERSVSVGKRSGFMHWREEAAFAALSTLSFPRIPTWEGTPTNEVGVFFLHLYSVGDGFEKQGGGPSWY